MVLLLLTPTLLLAKMTQADIDVIYTKPIVVEGKKSTLTIELPVDSTNGYMWFFVPDNYDYIRATNFNHESVDIENSKWGGMDNFKLQVLSRFKKSPQKIVLHFECFKPWDINAKPITKDITVLSFVD